MIGKGCVLELRLGWVREKGGNYDWRRLGRFGLIGSSRVPKLTTY